jgi:hypothetical protein
LKCLAQSVGINSLKFSSPSIIGNFVQRIQPHQLLLIRDIDVVDIKDRIQGRRRRRQDCLPGSDSGREQAASGQGNDHRQRSIAVDTGERV